MFNKKTKGEKCAEENWEGLYSTNKCLRRNRQVSVEITLANNKKTCTGATEGQEPSVWRGSLSIQPSKLMRKRPSHILVKYNCKEEPKSKKKKVTSYKRERDSHWYLHSSEVKLAFT